MIRFNNDYNCGAHPRVIEALVATNAESHPGYGLDAWCERGAQAIRAQAEAPEAACAFRGGRHAGELPGDRFGVATVPECHQCRYGAHQRTRDGRGGARRPQDPGFARHRRQDRGRAGGRSGARLRDQHRARTHRAAQDGLPVLHLRVRHAVFEARAGRPVRRVPGTRVVPVRGRRPPQLRPGRAESDGDDGRPCAASDRRVHRGRHEVRRAVRRSDRAHEPCPARRFPQQHEAERRDAGERLASGPAVRDAVRAG